MKEKNKEFQQNKKLKKNSIKMRRFQKMSDEDITEQLGDIDASIARCCTQLTRIADLLEKAFRKVHIE